MGECNTTPLANISLQSSKSFAHLTIKSCMFQRDALAFCDSSNLFYKTWARPRKIDLQRDPTRQTILDLSLSNVHIELVIKKSVFVLVELIGYCAMVGRIELSSTLILGRS